MKVRLSPEKAELIGLLCAEGSHILTSQKFYEADKRRKNKFLRNRKKYESVEFSNNDLKLITRFKELINSEYNYMPSVTGMRINKPKIIIKRKNVISGLLSHSDFGSLKWTVPNCVLDSPKRIKVSFLRGIFDGDGYIRRGKVCLYSINKRGIDGVSRILNDLDYRHSIYSTKRDKRRELFTIQIKRVSCNRFIKEIKPRKYVPV